MPSCLSAYARERIIRLWHQGETAVSIMKRLRKDGISTTHRTVTGRIFQWTNGGELDQGGLQSSWTRSWSTHCRQDAGSQ